jgi:hypothetical protein
MNLIQPFREALASDWQSALARDEWFFSRLEDGIAERLEKAAGACSSEDRDVFWKLRVSVHLIARVHVGGASFTYGPGDEPKSEGTQNDDVA